MKAINKDIKIIICDNAGKNNNLEEKFAENFKEIDFEFT